MKEILKNRKLHFGVIAVFTVIYTFIVYTETIGTMTKQNDYLWAVGLITMALGLGLVAAVSCLTLLKKMELYKVYPVIGLTLGIMFILVLPIYTTPDEAFHFDATYNLSNRMMGIEPPEKDGMEYRRKCDTEYYVALFREGAYGKFGDTFKKDFDTTLVQAEDRSFGDANFGAYCIPALGITLGRMLHLNFPLLVMLGTFFNTAWFVLWMTYALKKIPIGQRILMTILLLPITLQEVNSFSRDNPLIAATVLVIALSLHWRYSEEKVKISEIIVFAVSSYILITVKSALYAYLVLFAIVILANRGWFAGKHRKYAMGAIIGVALLGIVFLFPLQGWEKIVHILSTENYIAYAHAYGRSPWYYMTHMGELARIIGNTIQTGAETHILQIVGHGLGCLEIYNTAKVHTIYIVLALAATIRNEGEMLKLGFQTRFFSVLFGLTGIFLCLFAMLVFWNPADATIVDGIQGRYFIPVLLPIFIGLGYWKKPVIRMNLNLYYPIALAGMGYVIAVNVVRYNVLVNNL